MHILKQSTAVDVLIGPFVDLTDGATAETGESPSVKLSKNGQTLAAKNDATTPVHDADGYYNCELDATDTNTIGNMVLTVAASATALPVRHEFQVIEEAVYDNTYAASAVDVTVYLGSHGPGVYLDSGAANTNTVTGTDGTISNPVSTFAAARTLANDIGTNVYYIKGNSDLTLAATHEDWIFVGMGEVTSNIINLGSQDVDRSQFINLTVEGTQGGTGRLQVDHGALQDPGVGDTTLNIFARSCGIVDRIQVDTSADNVFDQCYSLVAGTSAPVIDATGAAGTISIRHYSGGIEFESLSASHNVSVETDGQVIFAADCNVNATVAIRGNCTITDNTAGMSNISDDARVVSLDAAMPGTPTANSPYDVLTDLDARLPGSGTLSVLNAAAVNAEVVDVFFTDTKAELGGIPAGTSTLADKITWNFMMNRNKLTETATLMAVRDDGDTTNVATAIVSDDTTTATRGEFS